MKRNIGRSKSLLVCLVHSLVPNNIIISGNLGEKDMKEWGEERRSFRKKKILKSNRWKELTLGKIEREQKVIYEGINY